MMSILTLISFLVIQALAESVNQTQTCPDVQYFDSETQPRSTENRSDRLVIHTLTGITKDGTNNEITKGIIKCLLDIKIKDEQNTTLAHITDLTSESVHFITNCNKQPLLFTYRFIGIEKSKIVTSECILNKTLIVGFLVFGLIIIILNILAFTLIWRMRRRGMRNEEIGMDEHQGHDYYPSEDPKKNRSQA